MSHMNDRNECPSIYQGTFSNPFFAEQFILIIYSLIFFIGLVGNIMTIIIIKYNAYLRTPTNFYLLNLAVSDLMMLMCNLPLEMVEIRHRQWPLPVIFCKLRNISAEFFTCSSILTILAFTCERYSTIVNPIYLHRLSHFRRARTIILIIWFISLTCSLPFGLFYSIENNPPTVSNNHTVYSLSNSCKSCEVKQNVAKLLSIIIIITSICFFYFPMIIIGAIYLFIGQALRRVNKYEAYSNTIELTASSLSTSSTKEMMELKRQDSHFNSHSWIKMRARCQARKVVVKTLVAVVSVFFICYAPLYLQRLLVALTTLNPNFHSESLLLSNFMAYLYVISGVTFYFGSVINPIIYNVLSNKYRRAFRDLFCCRLKYRRTRLPKQHRNFFTRQQQDLREHRFHDIKLHQNTNSNTTKQQILFTAIKKPLSTNTFTSRLNRTSASSHQTNKHFNLYH